MRKLKTVILFLLILTFSIPFLNAATTKKISVISKSGLSTADNVYIKSSTKLVQSSSPMNLISSTNKVTAFSFNELIVTLDPGHGGYDSGAVGSFSKEKDLNLKVALKVGAILKQNGINVIYTRTDDNVQQLDSTAEELQRRVDISDTANSDYFVSIHTNSSSLNTPTGIETYNYYGSTQGAQLASAVQGKLIQYTGAVNRGVKEAGFYVIKYTAAPAILVEMGFISTPSEENKLNTDDYQNKIAQAIAAGIISNLNR